MKYIRMILKKIPLLLLLVTHVACNQDDDVSPASNNTDSVTDFLTHGNGLRITLLTDDDDNETYYFDAYLFTFSTDGTVAATNANETVNGTYSVFRDDGKIELRMAFPNNPGFKELNDDWYFISINQSTIRFDDSGDILEFQQQ